ncbi:MAG: hypothetical protein ACI8Z5_001867, partial [Lentimonas sp.]
MCAAQSAWSRFRRRGVIVDETEWHDTEWCRFRANGSDSFQQRFNLLWIVGWLFTDEV